MSPPLEVNPLEVILEFDGTHLLFRTNDQELMNSVTQSHSAMVVQGRPDSAARLQVWRHEAGYTVEATESFEVKVEARQLFDFLNREILDTFVRLRTELVWLHAGVVHRNGKALLLVGPSGAGKSTLATLLCQKGWDFLSDEMAPVRLDSHEVIPYPRSPVRRIHPGRSLPAEEVLTLEREGWKVPTSRVFNRSLKIGWIVFPKFSYGSAVTLRPSPLGHTALELIRNCTNFDAHNWEAVTELADASRTISCSTLEYGDGREAAGLLDALPGQHLEGIAAM